MFSSLCKHSQDNVVSWSPLKRSPWSSDSILSREKSHHNKCVRKSATATPQNQLPSLTPSSYNLFSHFFPSSFFISPANLWKRSKMINTDLMTCKNKPACEFPRFAFALSPPPTIHNRGNNIPLPSSHKDSLPCTEVSRPGEGNVISPVLALSLAGPLLLTLLCWG